MSELIGLLHIEGSPTTLVDYVNDTYGTPKRLMLELPLDWKEVKESRFSNVGFFESLAEEYERKGSEIIPGDPNRYSIEPELSEKLRNIEEKLESEEFQGYESFLAGLKDNIIVNTELLKYHLIENYNLLMSRSKRKVRNEGFLTAYDDSQSDLIIVGDKHAQDLKRNNPELNYTYFMTDTLIERIAYSINSLSRKIKPDYFQVSPRSRS